ncbi:MAG: sulfite exporter TauE/SafE family protein [Hyphomicrobiaceae bacterium]
MPEHVLLIVAGALAGGFVLGLTGFGNGLTAYGLWLHVLPPQLGAPLVAIGSIIGHMQTFRGLRHAIHPRRFWPFIIGGLLGVPIGTWLLGVISTPAFKLFAGVVLAVYSIISLAGGLNFTLKRENRILDAIVGFVGGIGGGLASLSGPPLTIWCGLKGWPKDEQRGTYQPYNFAMLVAAMVSFAIAGLLTATFWKLALLTVPPTMAGVWLGRLLYGKVDDAVFRKIVLALLTLSGITLVWGNL